MSVILGMVHHVLESEYNLCTCAGEGMIDKEWNLLVRQGLYGGAFFGVYVHSER